MFLKLATFFCFIILFFVLSTKPVLAEGEFLSSYDINYEVEDDAKVLVTEKISFRNLTDRFYASVFSLSLNSTNIEGLEAFDDGGPLATEIKKEDGVTKITVKFNQQLTGKDKVYSWTLRFRSLDFVNKQGLTYHVSIPKISSTKDLDQVKATLLVPIKFGDALVISPTPVSSSEVGGKLQYHFVKEQLLDKGISAIFGEDQRSEFRLNYTLNNKSFLPKIYKVAIPSNNNYQNILVEKINPLPEDVEIDADGNYIALYQVNQRQSLEIEVSGLSQMKLNRKNISPEVLTKSEEQFYTKSQKYWESDDSYLNARLNEIFKEKNPKNNKEKAEIINLFVVELLNLDKQRAEVLDSSTRLGALTALNHPENALALEYTDLFIALARAADVPARATFGYGYSNNLQVKPLTYKNSSLHVWPQYFDPTRGWVMIDPTWESTSGGADFFTTFDLNHLTFASLGDTQNDVSLPDKVDFKFSEREFVAKRIVKIEILGVEEIISGFPAKARVRILNIGTGVYPGGRLSLNTSLLKILGEREYLTPEIPPWGKLEYSFNLRTSSFLQNGRELILVTYGKFGSNDQIGGEIPYPMSLEKQIIVKPLFIFNFFPLIVIFLAALMVIFYLGVLIFHIKILHKVRN